LIGGRLKITEAPKGWRIEVARSDRNAIDTVVSLKLDDPTEGIEPVLAFHSGSLAVGRRATSSCYMENAASKWSGIANCAEMGPDRAIDDKYDSR
jgi:hypothetical protein